MPGKEDAGFRKCAGGVVDDTGFGGVGNDDFQIVGNSQLHHFVEAVLFIGVQAAGNRGNNALVVHLLALFAAAQIQRVQTFLLVDHLSQTGSDGLHQAALAVPISLLIGQIEPVVDKCAQEIAFAELHDLFRCIFQNVAIIASLFQNLVIEFFHVNPPYWTEAILYKPSGTVPNPWHHFPR